MQIKSKQTLNDDEQNKSKSKSIITIIVIHIKTNTIFSFCVYSFRIPFRLFDSFFLPQTPNQTTPPHHTLKGLTASTTDIDSVANAVAQAAVSGSQHDIQQPYSLHRLYAARKLSTASNLKFTNNHDSSGMIHSQSTGDVASMFGRAWHV